MYRYLILALLIGLTFTACKEKNNPTINNSLSDSTAFLPVNDFIKEEIKDIEQNPYHLYKLTEFNPGSKDSTNISVTEFKNIANRFLEKDITAKRFRASFKESVFHDLTTKNIIITYTSIDSLSDIQNVSILLDDKTNKWKRIFIRSSFIKQDTSVIEQYNWKEGKSFQLFRSKTAATGNEIQEKVSVIWNDKTPQ